MTHPRHPLQDAPTKEEMLGFLDKHIAIENTAYNARTLAYDKPPNLHELTMLRAIRSLVAGGKMRDAEKWAVELHHPYTLADVPDKDALARIAHESREDAFENNVKIIKSIQSEAYAAGLATGGKDDGAFQLDCYDAGLLGNGGGGDVGWWQDYLRHELERAHAFYQSQVDGISTPPTPPQQADMVLVPRGLAEAAQAVLDNHEHGVTCGAIKCGEGSRTWEVYNDLKATLAAARKGGA